MKQLPVFVLLSCLSGALFAHPGDHGGGFARELLHTLSAADHLMLAAGVAVALVLVWRGLASLRAKSPDAAAATRPASPAPLSQRPE